MRGDIGQICLLLAGAFAFCQGVSGVKGGLFPQKTWQEVCRLTSFLHMGCMVTAFITLISAYVFCDFSLFNVFLNDHTRLPWAYRFCAVWGNHEGSMLLWSTLLGLMSGAYALTRPSPFHTLTLGIQGLISVLFLLFLWVWSNPFDLVHNPPSEGLSLNPLLQDQSLMVHPPLLYLGYVGFSLPFSMALAALILRDKFWAFRAHPWVLGAWSFLTLGIGWGSWWAYYELGWGGWWFWDPVENAALMPWLTGTALVHTLKVTQRKGALHRWSLFLALLTFSLSLLGTFLVRAGVLSSVHSFAHDPERGLILLLIFALVSGTGFAFWGWRWGERAPSDNADFPFLSREGGLAGQSLFLIGATGLIALGTLYPLFWEFYSGQKIAIGPAYFNSVLIPLMVLPFALMPVVPFLSWGKGHIPQALRSLAFAGTFSLGGLWAVWTLWDFPSLVAGGGIVGALWIASGTLSLLKRRKSQNSSFYGMVLSHLGVALCLAGLSGGSFLRQEAEKIMTPGSVLSVGPYVLQLAAVSLEEGPNYQASRAQVIVQREGKTVTTLTPERRLYHPQEVLLSEIAIHTTGFSDLYLVLGSYFGPEKWQIKASYTPLVSWIWLGVIAMFLGGMMGLLQRVRASRKSTPTQEPFYSTP